MGTEPTERPHWSTEATIYLSAQLGALLLENLHNINGIEHKRSKVLGIGPQKPYLVGAYHSNDGSTGAASYLTDVAAATPTVTATAEKGP